MFQSTFQSTPISKAHVPPIHSAYEDFEVRKIKTPKASSWSKMSKNKKNFILIEGALAILSLIIIYYVHLQLGALNHAMVNANF